MACDDIGVGLDHRATKILLALHAPEKRERRGRLLGNMRGWIPKHEKEYQTELDANLGALGEMTVEIEKRCRDIETILLEVAAKCQEIPVNAEHDDDSRTRLHGLIAQRRSARKSGCKSTVKSVSKAIQKEMQSISKARKSGKISRVLAEFKDLQRLVDIRNNGKRVCMSSVLDEAGEEKTDKDDIAEVFASFFESVYSGAGSEVMYQEFCGRVDAVTLEEIRLQLKKMRPRKAPDGNGIVSELLCQGSDMLIELIADIFTAVMNPQTTIPEYWKASSIKVLFKKGDQRLPGNYRPICIIPILYKLFSRILCGRIKEKLIAEQSEDQAGFRPDYSCDDHLFAITMLIEK